MNDNLFIIWQLNLKLFIWSKQTIRIGSLYCFTYKTGILCYPARNPGTNCLKTVYTENHKFRQTERQAGGQAGRQAGSGAACWSSSCLASWSSNDTMNTSQSFDSHQSGMRNHYSDSTHTTQPQNKLLESILRFQLKNKMYDKWMIRWSASRTIIRFVDQTQETRHAKAVDFTVTVGLF